jgi:hypothetical protein
MEKIIIEILTILGRSGVFVALCFGVQIIIWIIAGIVKAIKTRSIKAFQHIVFDDKWGASMCWRIMAASTCFSVLMYFIINAIG